MRARIQRFEVQDLLGTGAMGAVYRARDPQLGREVAIKVLARPAAQASSLLSTHGTLDLRGGAPAGELLTEAQMMARLSHPNVLPVYEVGLDGDEMFLVMEYIAGPDLRAWLAETRPVRAIAAVFAQAARGLAAAHQHGIVHGDFKPENVLVGEDGRVRVADFGLSRLASQPVSPLRVEREVGGTPYYMAPELWSGGEASAAGDVYAFCKALAEAFGAESPDRTERDGQLRGRGVPRRVRAQIADGLGDAPQDRPALADVIAALEAGSGRPRRWIAAIAGGAAAIAAVSFLVLPGDAEATCEADGVQLAGRWDDRRRAALEASQVAGRFDAHRRNLDETLRAVCAAEKRGELSAVEARQRTSCVERRGFELDAAAAHIAALKAPAELAKEVHSQIPEGDECMAMDAPPLPDDRAPIAALYRRLIATQTAEFASPQRSAELAAIEKEARERGDRELEGRAAVLLGMRQIETDQLADADASFARAHELAMAIHAPAMAVEALIERGITAHKRADPAAALAYSKLAYELVDKPSATRGVRIYATYALARAQAAVGQPLEAIRLVDQALALKPRDAWSQQVLRQVKIMALGQLGRDDEVLPLAREVAEISRVADGEDHPDYGIALNVIAGALVETGDRLGALDLRKRALAIMSAALPADSSTVLFQRDSVAADLTRLGRFEEAIAERRALLGIVERNESAGAVRSDFAVGLGSTLFQDGRFDEAMRYIDQGVDDFVSRWGQDHPDSLDYRLLRVGFELELGRWDDAERHIDALERSYRARKDQALALARLDGLYRGWLARARRDPRAAEARARAALAAWKELRGGESDREDLLLVLGASLTDQGRWKEALETLAAAATISKARHEREDGLAIIQAEQARALAGLGRRAEARALASQALAVFRRFPGRPSSRAVAEAVVRGRPAR